MLPPQPQKIASHRRRLSDRLATLGRRSRESRLLASVALETLGGCWVSNAPAKRVSGAPLKLPSSYVGRWLRAQSHRQLGLGYCRAVQGGKLVLSYVDIPDISESELLVSVQDVVDKPIPVGTRVWVRGKPNGWHPGVILSEATGHRYQVSMVGRARRFLLHQDQFKVRWSQPLENPAVAVAAGLVEGPIFHEARSQLLDELTLQRRVCRGLTAAISAPIKLYQHQIDTAARVLADPVMRYLLADEVGLGKTIEAGIVIRQLLIDDPKSEILVLCPEGLKGQWTAELRDRLGLGKALLSPQLTVASHSSLPAYANQWNDRLGHYDLIVVDEAHNLFREFGDDSVVERDFEAIRGLLALSATPMRGDIETFLRLLTLVDPVAFRGMSLDGFRNQLDERARSAGDVQVLSTRRASLRQKNGVLDSIAADFPDDENVATLVAACRASQDPQAPVFTALADYVREIYRLSRRMIRHRRTSELTDSYKVAGRVPTFVELADPARIIIDDFLESYRLRLGGRDSAEAFTVAVSHALAGPVAMRTYLATPSIEDDRVLFEMVTARLETAGTEYRLRLARDVVSDRIGQGKRVVVASAFGCVLQRFEAMIAECVERRRVHRHYESMPYEDRTESVAEFLSDYHGGVLLADASIEEGHNLQDAEVLVNLDIPLDVNQLEQRIGRLDRYTERSSPAEVVVFTEENSDWVSAHTDMLHRGIGVFEHSVSTVQRLLSNLLKDLTSLLVVRGVDAFRIDLEALREELESERESIDLLEELESIESATVFTAEAFEELLDYETGSTRLRNAVRRFTTGEGSLALRPVESRNGVTRFGNPDCIGLSSEEAEELRGLLQPKAFDRTAAWGNSGISPFRVGDPLVDWIREYLLSDERGLATAIVRPVPKLVTPTLWMHCEFMVEFDSEQSAVQDRSIRRRLTRRAESSFQPLRIETWTDASGPAPADLVSEVLSRPYDHKEDAILRGPSWGPLLEELPAWSTLCRQSAEAAWEQVRSSGELATSVTRASEAARLDGSRRQSILEARSRRLSTEAERSSAHAELELERAMATAVLSGIQTPQIRLVSCGACVLWPAEDFD